MLYFSRVLGRLIVTPAAGKISQTFFAYYSLTHYSGFLNNKKNYIVLHTDS